MRLTLALAFLCLPLLADEAPLQLDMTASGLKNTAKQHESTAGWAQTAQTYEEQAARGNKVIENLKSKTDTGLAQPKRQLASAEAASSPCSRVDSWETLKGCVYGLFGQVYAAPEIAKELKKEQ